MQAKMVPKMAPTWLQNGPVWAWIKKVWVWIKKVWSCINFGCHLGPLLGSKIGPGTPQERHVDRFQPPGGSPGGSRRGSGRSFWGAFWRVGRRERKNSPKFTKKSFFLEVFLRAFSCISRVCSVRLGARRRKSTTLKYA